MRIEVELLGSRAGVYQHYVCLHFHTFFYQQLVFSDFKVFANVVNMMKFNYGVN